MKPGDRLTLWLRDDRVWQIASDSALLLPYPSVLKAHADAKRRQYQMCIGAVAVSLPLLLIGYWRRWLWRRDLI